MTVVPSGAEVPWAFGYGGEREGVPVRGAVAGALRLSRAFGVAPLCLRTRRGITYARLSRPQAIYGYILNTIIGCATVIKILPWELNDECKMSMPKKLASVLNEAKMVFMMIIVITLAYRSNSRMKRLLNYIRTIEQVKIRVYYGRSETDVKKRIVVASLLLALLLGMMISWCHTRLYVDCGSKVLDIGIGLMSYLEHFVFLVTELQIVFLMYAVQGAVRTVNEELARLQHQLSRPYVSWSTDSKHCEVMQEASRSYVAVCRMVRDINKNEGALILLMLICFIVNIVFVNYFFFDLLASHTGNNSYLLVLYLYHTIEMMILMDPGYQISQEMCRTRVLLSRLQYERRLASASASMYKHLMLHSPTFSPLGILTFNRLLIVSIISLVTTSVATLLQYRKAS